MDPALTERKKKRDYENCSWEEWERRKKNDVDVVTGNSNNDSDGRPDVPTTP
jgi:hypothetical protein